MRNDLKIKALRRKFSHKGYSIYVMMLEHLSNCEYLQYEWNELSIELLTSDFDIDNDELMEIIDYSIKLKLFDIEVGYIFCPSMLTRNQHILSERKCFDLNNSPITKLNRDLLSKSPINSGETQLLGNKTEISTHSIVKESKVKESKEKNSKVKESIEEKSIRQILNEIYFDFPEWEQTFWSLGIDNFIINHTAGTEPEIELLNQYLKS